jgi:hypothetical protein
MTPAYAFPCSANKKPRLTEWQRKLFQWQEWKNAELVGVQTGEHNGFDVLDVDTYKPSGAAWYDTNKSKLPTTLVHETRQGGKHFFFVHAPKLRGSEGRIAAGVDVRAEGNYAIWWPREGYAVEDAPLAPWPSWLLEEARKPTRDDYVDPRQAKKKRDEERVEVAGLVEALRQMDPVDWREKFQSWFALCGAVKAVGICKAAFLDWTTQDPQYAHRREEIERIWDSALGAHGRAFYKALSDRGIKIIPSGNAAFCLSASRVHPVNPRPSAQPFKLRPTVNVIARSNHTCKILEQAQGSWRREELFNSACVMAEMIGEKQLTVETANQLLRGALQTNGLWRENRELCETVIGRAYRHVELKFLGEAECDPLSNGEQQKC